MIKIKSTYIHPLILAVLSFFTSQVVAEVPLEEWQQANIDWQSQRGAHINVLADQQPAFMALKPYLPIFEQLTGIKVGFHPLEQSAMRYRRELDLKDNLGIYDVMPMGITFLGQAVANNWLLPLQAFIDNPKVTDKQWYQLSDINQQSLNLCQINNTLYSLPFDFSAPILFYRKDIFDKFLLKPPNTYDELVNLKPILQNALDSDPQFQGTYAFASRTLPAAGLNTWTVLPIMRAYGARVINDQKTAAINTPEAVASLRVYKQLVTGYGTPANSKLLHFYEIRELFKQGKLASAFLASHFYNEIDTPSESMIWNKWDTVPLPSGPNGRFTSPWAWSFAINAKSKQADAAWLFIQWATSEPTANLLSTGGSPARLKVWQEQLFSFVNKPGFTETMKWVFTTTPDTIQSGRPDFPIIGKIIAQAFSQIFYDADIEETLDKTNTKLNHVISISKEQTSAH